ncbi:hypothetical protein HYE67_005526 [Fusarium culmorum]|uniref:Apple domain-containing protein n=1 Tax=Fusarium culmorum TaxID=5516 RepID=A0A7S8HWD6_FUSCU|nr:hypothetical protein HYE67_005526 [Fusarium culmorum]
MVSFKSILVLLALGTNALAGPEKPISSTCSTYLGSKTVKNVPTATTTAIKNITITKKVIRRVNIVVVPQPKTTTVRTIETNTITHTDYDEVATVTVTSDKSTRTNLRTTWSTKTSTSWTTTTKSFTSTITTTPVGFTAILDDASYIMKRDLLIERDQGGDVSPPVSVRCVKDIPKYSSKTVTTNIQGPRRTLNAATKTKTLTSFTSVTTTVYPEASFTETITEYHQIVTTDVEVTSTTTVPETGKIFLVTIYLKRTYTNMTCRIATVESWIPQATVYDICGSRNMLRTANDGGSVGTYRDADGISYADLGKGFNEVSCCNACAADPYCRGTNYDPRNTACYAYISRDKSQCSTSRNLLARYVTWLFEGGGVFSNGPCGFWENGGRFTV